LFFTSTKLTLSTTRLKTLYFQLCSGASRKFFTFFRYLEINFEVKLSGNSKKMKNFEMEEGLENKVEEFASFFV
jgi:hypothetical protein